MISKFAAAAVLLASASALAQTAAVAPLQQEGNAADRGVTACKKGNQQAKCKQEIETAGRWNNDARRAVGLPELVPAPAPTPSPSPTPTPVPTPSPTPTPLAGVLSEGDSISIKWGGSHTGIYAAAHTSEPFWGNAVGGSGVAQLNERFAADAALRPMRVTVQIGANDLVRWNAASEQPFLTDLWAYVGRWQATGAKVYVGTILAQCIANNPTFNATHNSYRAKANAAIRTQPGIAVYDFAADPVMGTDAAACDKALFSDGTHPTDAGQQKLATIYTAALDHVVPVPPTGYVTSPSINGAADLVAEFPIAEGLAPAWGTGAIPGPYGGGEGAFRFVCGAEGALNYDDPLVKFGQPGASHLHRFWGPTTIDANTTMESLAASVGNSTCNYGAKTLNRSGYWMPAMIDKDGYVRNADWIGVYYKGPMPGTPRCTEGSSTFEGKCIGLPNEIRYVWGWNQFDPDAPVQGASWYCSGGTGGHFKNLDEVFQSGCKAGDQLVADLAAPQCWNGIYLDTPDHRSHMSYPSYGSWGYIKCPATHPYRIPQNESKVAWTVTADMYETVSGVVRSRIMLASDAMKPGAKPGETLHSDYMEQWVEAAKRLWQENCIAKGLSCSGGDLGNGQQLVGANMPAYGWTNPNPRTPIPANPHAVH